MANYKSAYTGPEIDEGIAKAMTALQEEDLPEEVTEETVAEWGFTKNTGTYSKPNEGIPKTDLTSSVQSSLEKADAALQPDKVKTTTSTTVGDVYDVTYINTTVGNIETLLGGI